MLRNLFQFYSKLHGKSLIILTNMPLINANKKVSNPRPDKKQIIRPTFTGVTLRNQTWWESSRQQYVQVKGSSDCVQKLKPVLKRWVSPRIRASAKYLTVVEPSIIIIIIIRLHDPRDHDSVTAFGGWRLRSWTVVWPGWNCCGHRQGGKTEHTGGNVRISRCWLLSFALFFDFSHFGVCLCQTFSFRHRPFLFPTVDRYKAVVPKHFAITSSFKT